MKLSQINQRVQDHVLDRFPYLAGHVTFDTVFESASAMATIFHTTVEVNGTAAYRAIRLARAALSPDQVPDNGGVRESNHILRDLFSYRSDLGGDQRFDDDTSPTHYLIGDGDDYGAVWESGIWSITMWVRILELGQDDFAMENDG